MDNGNEQAVPVGFERREQERWPASFRAMLRRRAVPDEPIVIYDISPLGCRFESRWQLPVGERVRLQLPNLEPWTATVVWTNESEGGLQFDRPLHVAVAERFAKASQPEHRSSSARRQTATPPR